MDFCLESLETRLRGVSVVPRRVVGMGLPVVLHDVTLPEFCQEVLVMRDDYELEVGDISALVDDAVQRRVSAHMPRRNTNSLTR